MTLEFKIKNQQLIPIENKNFIVEKSQEYLKVKFNFETDDWKDTYKLAIFSHSNTSKNISVELDENNECFVPSELILNGSLIISLLGVKDTYRVTTNVSVLQIRKTGEIFSEKDLKENDNYSIITSSFNNFDLDLDEKNNLHLRLKRQNGDIEEKVILLKDNDDYIDSGYYDTEKQAFIFNYISGRKIEVNFKIDLSNYYNSEQIDVKFNELKEEVKTASTSINETKEELKNKADLVGDNEFKGNNTFEGEFISKKSLNEENNVIANLSQGRMLLNKYDDAEDTENNYYRAAPMYAINYNSSKKYLYILSDLLTRKEDNKVIDYYSIQANLYERDKAFTDGTLKLTRTTNVRNAAGKTIHTFQEWNADYANQTWYQSMFRNYTPSGVGITGIMQSPQSLLIRSYDENYNYLAEIQVLPGKQVPEDAGGDTAAEIGHLAMMSDTGLTFYTYDSDRNSTKIGNLNWDKDYLYYNGVKLITEDNIPKSSGTKILTQSQFDELTDEEKNNGTLYMIDDEFKNAEEELF